MSGEVLAIVPVGLSDRQAPVGAPALRSLRGVTLLGRAVENLLRSGLVHRVVVAAPATLQMTLTDLIATLPAVRANRSEVRIDVTATQGPGPGHRVRSVLEAQDARAGGTAEVVLVHDPLHPLAPVALFGSVLEALLQADADVGAAVPVRPVTDTLKWVDGDDLITDTADRDGFCLVYSPQAFRREALSAALAGASEAALHMDSADALPRMVQATGGRLISVPAPGEVFRIADAEDVLMAEAMLHVAAGQGRPS